MGWWRRILRPPRLGLALGGGAARGLAHIGVLEVLEEADILPDLIGGVSFGAFVGASYAGRRDAGRVAEDFRRFLARPEFRETRLHFFIQETDPDAQGGFFAAIQSMMKRGIFYTSAMRREGFLSPEEFRALVTGVVPACPVEELAVPFFAVAADLHSGEEILLGSGPTQEVVMASCAIPGVMPPVHFDGRTLVDGGCVRKLPGNHLRRRGADLVLGVDVSDFSALGLEEEMSGVDVIMRGYAIKDERLRALGRQECDLVLRVNASRIHWADFNRIDECIEAGRRAARRALGDVRASLENASRLWARWQRRRPPTEPLEAATPARG